MRASPSVGDFFGEIYRTYIVEMPNNFAAALSYYSLFSLVPTLYIAFLVARLFIDDMAAMQFLFARVEVVMGAEVAELLQDTLVRIAEDSSNRANIDLVVISLSNLLLSFFGSLLQLQLDVPYLNAGTNWLVYAAAIALTFRFLPNARISWRAAFIGAGVTAFLLLAGTKILGWYLARGHVGSAFEAAGTVAVLLIAIYFLAQFFIFGAVLTRVFADFYGGGIHPRHAPGS